MMGAESLGKKSVQNASQAAPALEHRYMPANDSFAEKHYRVSDLAKLWGLGRETVRKLVKDDPGVIKVRQGARKCIPHIACRNRPRREFIRGG
jgi:hypothetical protein